MERLLNQSDVAAARTLIVFSENVSVITGNVPMLINKTNPQKTIWDYTKLR